MAFLHLRRDEAQTAIMCLFATALSLCAAKWPNQHDWGQTGTIGWKFELEHNGSILPFRPLACYGPFRATPFALHQSTLPTHYARVDTCSPQ